MDIFKEFLLSLPLWGRIVAFIVVFMIVVWFLRWFLCSKKENNNTSTYSNNSLGGFFKEFLLSLPLWGKIIAFIVVLMIVVWFMGWFLFIYPNSKNTTYRGGFSCDYIAGDKVYGDKFILSKKDSVIRSLEFKIHLDYISLDGAKNTDGDSLGLANVVALFSKEKVRYRFITDYQYKKSTLDSGRKRISFRYQPEESDQILGKPINFLKDIQVLVLNYSEFIKSAQLKIDKSNPIIFHWDVYLNSIKVITISSKVVAETICKGQETMDIGKYFNDIDEIYEQAVR